TWPGCQRAHRPVGTARLAATQPGESPRRSRGQDRGSPRFRGQAAGHTVSSGQRGGVSESRSPLSVEEVGGAMGGVSINGAAVAVVTTESAEAVAAPPPVPDRPAGWWRAWRRGGGRGGWGACVVRGGGNRGRLPDPARLAGRGGLGAAPGAGRGVARVRGRQGRRRRGLVRPGGLRALGRILVGRYRQD